MDLWSDVELVTHVPKFRIDSILMKDTIASFECISLGFASFSMRRIPDESKDVPVCSPGSEQARQGCLACKLQPSYLCSHIISHNPRKGPRRVETRRNLVWSAPACFFSRAIHGILWDLSIARTLFIFSRKARHHGFSWGTS